MKLWISNLDRSSQVDEIEELFAEFGEVVRAVRMEDPDEGKDTFSAMVEMPYDEDAEDAIAELNGEHFDGQIIKVKRASEENLALLSKQDAAENADGDEEESDDFDTLVPDDALVDEDDPNFEPKGWEPITRKRPGKNNRDW